MNFLIFSKMKLSGIDKDKMEESFYKVYLNKGYLR